MCFYQISLIFVKFLILLVMAFQLSQNQNFNLAIGYLSAFAPIIGKNETKWYCPVSIETINISHVVLRLLWSRFSSRRPEVYWKTYCNIYSRVSFLIKMQTPPATLFKNGDLAQVFSCEFCKIFKNAILLEQLWWLLLLDQLWWLLLQVQ